MYHVLERKCMKVINKILDIYNMLLILVSPLKGANNGTISWKIL